MCCETGSLQILQEIGEQLTREDSLAEEDQYLLEINIGQPPGRCRSIGCWPFSHHNGLNSYGSIPSRTQRAMVRQVDASLLTQSVEGADIE